MNVLDPWTPVRDQLKLLDERIAAAGRDCEEVARAHEGFRSSPVAGRYLRVKRLIYKLVGSTFAKQHDHNERILALLRDMQSSLKQQQEVIEALGQIPAGVNGKAQQPAAPAEPPLEGVAGLNQRMPGFLRVFNTVAQLRWPERALIYSLVFGLKPRRMLEIGTAQGGSALIACGAMDDTGYGNLYCVDMKFQVSAAHWSLLRHRTTFVEGPSPDSLGQAARAAGAGFDFAFIDGDHTCDGLLRDIEGTLPHMADDAYLLFHDSHHADVKKAIDAVAGRRPELIDCGELSAEQTVHDVPEWGINLWGGLRLLRYRRRSLLKAAGDGKP